MDTFGDAINIIYQIATVIFVITTFIIIRTVRKSNLEIVKSAITNPFWPDLNLSFYPWVLRKYSQIKQSKVLVSINLISLIVGLLGVIYLFGKAILSNLVLAWALLLTHLA